MIYRFTKIYAFFFGHLNVLQAGTESGDPCSNVPAANLPEDLTSPSQPSQDFYYRNGLIISPNPFSCPPIPATLPAQHEASQVISPQSHQVRLIVLYVITGTQSMVRCNL